MMVRIMQTAREDAPETPFMGRLSLSTSGGVKRQSGHPVPAPEVLHLVRREDPAAAPHPWVSGLGRTIDDRLERFPQGREREGSGPVQRRILFVGVPFHDGGSVQVGVHHCDDFAGYPTSTDMELGPLKTTGRPPPGG